MKGFRQQFGEAVRSLNSCEYFLYHRFAKILAFGGARTSPNARILNGKQVWRSPLVSKTPAVTNTSGDENERTQTTHRILFSSVCVHDVDLRRNNRLSGTTATAASGFTCGNFGRDFRRHSASVGIGQFSNRCRPEL